jgi:osmotically-inducible protein OsmY
MPSPETVPGVSPSVLLGTIALRRGQPQGPANDQDIEEFMYDALELFWGTNEVEVRSEQGRVTLTGSVQQKRLKRDIGEIAWAIAAVADVQNNVTITARRRSRGAARETAEASPNLPARKQS